MNKIKEQKKNDSLMSLALGLILFGFGFSVGSGILDFIGVILIILGLIIYLI